MSKKIFLYIFLFSLQSYVFAVNQNIVLEAKYYESAIDSDIWRININEYDDLSGGILNYKYNHGLSGLSLKGESSIHSDVFTKLRHKLREIKFFEIEQSFFENPNRGVPFHATEFFIKICEGEKCNSIELHYPEGIEISSKRSDFFKLWEFIVSEIPKWPKVPEQVPPNK